MLNLIIEGQNIGAMKEKNIHVNGKRVSKKKYDRMSFKSGDRVSLETSITIPVKYLEN